ncbi:hypothetical protein DH2020_008003 [Rehmannia glutinosa]|uniref:Protein-S-isoprenylcysteine O-methyltransferase n=1 Tax=Rehmannia glutinosa TaxID=99300 RepID=A0ABR0TZT4_REHGL
MASTLNSKKNLRNAVVALLAPLPSIFFYVSFLPPLLLCRCRFSFSPSGLGAIITLFCWPTSSSSSTSTFFSGLSVTSSPATGFVFYHNSHSSNFQFLFNRISYWFCMSVIVKCVVPDDRFVLDGDTCVAGSLFRNTPVGRIECLEIEARDPLTWVWSVRLTHSYFRREKWQWGAREDWRFSDMRLQYGKNWWWASFFAIYLSQQCALTVLPLRISPTQLHNFVSRNENLKHLGKALVPNLDEGLWRYSRHPNYFVSNYGGGDWSSSLGTWIIDGVLLVHWLIACACYVTILVEERMLKQEYRAEAYKEYQKRRDPVEGVEIMGKNFVEMKVFDVLLEDPI